MKKAIFNDAAILIVLLVLQALNLVYLFIEYVVC